MRSGDRWMLSLVVALPGCLFEPPLAGVGGDEDTGEIADATAADPIDASEPEEAGAADAAVAKDAELDASSEDAAAPLDAEIEDAAPLDPPWLDPSYSRRKQIIIDATRVDAPGGGALSDYPVLIAIEDPDIQRAARPDGFDILFAAELEKLDHEIETYEPATGRLVAWVRIPSLSSSVDTAIFVYYGNPGAADGSNSAAVWNQAFVGVWHLSEVVSDESSAAVHADSTSHAHHAAQSGNDDSLGEIDLAQDFDGSNDFAQAATTPALEISGTAVTVEAWINADTWATDSFGGTIVDKHTWANNVERGYVLRAGDGGRASFNFGDSNRWNDSVSNRVMTAGTWHYVVGRYDGNTISVFVDGVSQAAVSENDPMTSSPSALRIGRGTFDQNRIFDGKIDEVRVSNVARPNEWIATTYNNQSSPRVGGFLRSIGPEELAP